MKTVIVYLGLAAAGYAAAIPLRGKKESFGWMGTFLMVLVRGLVLLMGFRIGSNAEVVSNLATIGLQSLVISLVSMAFTIAGLHVLRRIMGYDRYGHPVSHGKTSAVGAEESAGKTAFAGSVLNKSTVTMLVSVISGFLLGFLLILQFEIVGYEAAYAATGVLVTWGLYVMVFLVGMDMGFDGTVITVFRQTGLRLLAFPLVTAAATLAGVMLCSLISPLNLQESAAVACTFCWYSLGPNIIMDAGFVMAGAYCFLVNFMRVLISLITVPVVASRIGYLETVGMPCAASMDVCIATIQNATNKETAVYAFASGVIFTAAIPLILPLIVG